MNERYQSFLFHDMLYTTLEMGGDFVSLMMDILRPLNCLQVNTLLDHFP